MRNPRCSIHKVSFICSPPRCNHRETQWNIPRKYTIYTSPTISYTEYDLIFLICGASAITNISKNYEVIINRNILDCTYIYNRTGMYIYNKKEKYNMHILDLAYSVEFTWDNIFMRNIEKFKSISLLATFTFLVFKCASNITNIV